MNNSQVCGFCVNFFLGRVIRILRAIFDPRSCLRNPIMQFSVCVLNFGSSWDHVSSFSILTLLKSIFFLQSQTVSSSIFLSCYGPVVVVVPKQSAFISCPVPRFIGQGIGHSHFWARYSLEESTYRFLQREPPANFSLVRVGFRFYGFFVLLVLLSFVYFVLDLIFRQVISHFSFV